MQHNIVWLLHCHWCLSANKLLPVLLFIQYQPKPGSTLISARPTPTTSKTNKKQNRVQMSQGLALKGKYWIYRSGYWQLKSVYWLSVDRIVDRNSVGSHGVEVVSRDDHHQRHRLVNQRQWPVLQLARWNRLGMHVSQFFNFLQSKKNKTIKFWNKF